MQLGMIPGYLTAWPVNRRLVPHGLKEPMDHRRHLGTMLQQLADERAGEDEPVRRQREAGPVDRPVSGR